MGGVRGPGVARAGAGPAGAAGRGGGAGVAVDGALPWLRGGRGGLPPAGGAAWCTWMGRGGPEPAGDGAGGGL